VGKNLRVLERTFYTSFGLKIAPSFFVHPSYSPSRPYQFCSLSIPTNLPFDVLTLLNLDAKFSHNCFVLQIALSLSPPTSRYVSGIQSTGYSINNSKTNAYEILETSNFLNLINQGLTFV
jgi:hypothetical protein